MIVKLKKNKLTIIENKLEYFGYRQKKRQRPAVTVDPTEKWKLREGLEKKILTDKI